MRRHPTPTRPGRARAARLGGVLVLLGALVAGLWPLAATSEEVESAGLTTPASRRAAEKALKWLDAHQREDGAWHCDVGFKLNNTYHVEHPNKAHVGVTALGGTAFLASGSVPGRGPYAENVDKALEYILSKQDKRTGFITDNGTRMYSHAFATLFLAEVYGTTRDERIRKALQRAVEFTYKAQNDQGGWRYVPNAEDSDMSITVCQVVAMRAAKNKGIRVPKKSIDAAVDYVLRSAVTRDTHQFRKGAFLYQYQSTNRAAEENTRTSFALTAAGLTTLYGAGVYTDEDIRRFVQERQIRRYLQGRDPMPSFRSMVDYVLSSYDGVQRSWSNHYFYFYGNYYAAQAMFITGGRPWERYYTRVRDDLVSTQLRDGSWENVVRYAPRDGTRPEYPMSTAIGAMLLQIPNNYLPIFQR